MGMAPLYSASASPGPSPRRRVGTLTECASRRFPSTSPVRRIVVSLINGVKAWRRSASDLRRSREENFVPASLINDAEHWRKRADEARSLVDDMNDEISKQMTLQIADDYEHLARRDLGNAGSPRTRCGNRDRQRFARSRSELDDVRAVVLRPLDHDPIPTIERHDCHPCFGGSLCTNSGHRFSITARISSEMKSMRSYSRSSVCSRSKSADVMT